MWLRLTTAEFKAVSEGGKGNLGTLDQYTITHSGSGYSYSGPSYWDKSSDDAFSATITLLSGYTLNSISVSMGGTVQSGAVTDNENGTYTINLAAVTGDITITVSTTGSSSGGGEEDEPTPGGTIITYTSRQSSSGISKSTGEYLSSTTGYVNIYENIDPTKTYAATGYAPASTGDNACVCYYTSEGTFISAESGSDWGVSSAEYTMQELTVPSAASIIKLFGRTNNQEAVLYLTSTISMTEISYSSQSTSSNMNETTGELGSSSSGYVNVYDNIDASKTYYASGFCPNASGTAAFVCYYTSDGTFISAQDGNDFGASSENVVKQKLTVPSTTSTIKVFAQSGQTAAALYVEA